MEMTLPDRINEILAAGYSKADLARAAKVTPASVTHWISGETKVLKARSAIGIQRETGFSSDWISDGIGPKMVETVNKSEPRQLAAVPVVDVSDAVAIIASKMAALSEAGLAVVAVQLAALAMDPTSLRIQERLSAMLDGRAVDLPVQKVVNL